MLSKFDSSHINRGFGNLPLSSVFSTGLGNVNSLTKISEEMKKKNTIKDDQIKIYDNKISKKSSVDSLVADTVLKVQDAKNTVKSNAKSISNLLKLTNSFDDNEKIASRVTVEINNIVKNSDKPLFKKSDGEIDFKVGSSESDSIKISTKDLDPERALLYVLRSDSKGQTIYEKSLDSMGSKVGCKFKKFPDVSEDGIIIPRDGGHGRDVLRNAALNVDPAHSGLFFNGYEAENITVTFEDDRGIERSTDIRIDAHFTAEEIAQKFKDTNDALHLDIKGVRAVNAITISDFEFDNRIRGGNQNNIKLIFKADKGMVDDVYVKTILRNDGRHIGGNGDMSTLAANINNDRECFERGIYAFLHEGDHGEDAVTIISRPLVEDDIMGGYDMGVVNIGEQRSATISIRSPYESNLNETSIVGRNRIDIRGGRVFLDLGDKCKAMSSDNPNSVLGYEGYEINEKFKFSAKGLPIGNPPNKVKGHEIVCVCDGKLDARIRVRDRESIGSIAKSINSSTKSIKAESGTVGWITNIPKSGSFIFFLNDKRIDMIEDLENYTEDYNFKVLKDKINEKTKKTGVKASVEILKLRNLEKKAIRLEGVKEKEKDGIGENIYISDFTSTLKEDYLKPVTNDGRFFVPRDGNLDGRGTKFPRRETMEIVSGIFNNEDKPAKIVVLESGCTFGNETKKNSTTIVGHMMLSSEKNCEINAPVSGNVFGKEVNEFKPLFYQTLSFEDEASQKESKKALEKGKERTELALGEFENVESKIEVSKEKTKEEVKNLTEEKYKEIEKFYMDMFSFFTVLEQTIKLEEMFKMMVLRMKESQHRMQQNIIGGFSTGF